MVIDASAIVAILTQEPEGPSLLERLAQASEPVIPSHAVFEATLAISRKFSQPLTQAEARIARFAEFAGARIVALDEVAVSLSIKAHAQFGKSSGHPARLNMGDCFSYGVAKSLGTPLLFKGNDFSQTDIIAA